MRWDALVLRNGNYVVAAEHTHVVNFVALRHYDRDSTMHVITKLSEAEVGALPLSQRELLGDAPVLMAERKFVDWVIKYQASERRGLDRYHLLKKVGIPFTGLRHELLDDAKFQWRAAVADMMLLHDLEDSAALIHLSPKAGPLNVEDFNCRWLTGRWFAFKGIEDAATVKLTYATRDITARLIEL